MARAGTALDGAEEGGVSDLRYCRMFPQTCDEGVTRKGEFVPCEKVAVAVRLAGGLPYPVCAYHARGEMVPLAELLGLS